MLFSSIVFIYYFLLLLLLVYFIVPNKYRNFVLLVFSLVFYFLGEPKYIVVLLLSCFINYYLGKIIEVNKYSKLFLVVAILYNVGQLFVFKYIDFFIDNINNFFDLNIPFTYIVMPIGISFFTFQALGYVIDVYNKKHKSADSLMNFMTYICLFPQLVAGPIVRYSDVKDELLNREVSYAKFSLGVRRFIIGLSKKVLIANVLGEFVKLLIEQTVLSSWLKAFAYTFQIYFDFSGYSDMAIGLGLMFGFKFLENFNYPLIASSVTDFWRRWHMSLSSWFKDYIYIPLGGNRVNKFKWFRNIFVVWFLTGFWHGASWNFIIWGLYFGVILVVEKLLFGNFINKTKILKYIYTFLIVVISFLIFSTENVSNILVELMNMFFLNDIPIVGSEVIYQLRNHFVLFIIAIISATPIMNIIINKIKCMKYGKIIDILEPIYLVILLTISTSFLIDASFNPFLYFRF